ncbi:MAG: hypothetical protein GXY82_09270 [Methanospirillum sp.]|nr:hypothetical protein [Methanospirillum sp.]
MTAEAVSPPGRVTISDEAWAELVRKTRARKATEKSEFTLRCEETYTVFGNGIPEPTELTIAEFARSGFFSQVPAGMFYRWNVPDPATPGQTIRVQSWWFADGTWIGMAHDYWASTVRFFRGALCDHQYRSLPQRWNCYHEAICVKCGHFDAYDSSG